MFRPLSDHITTPSEELLHFTNRVSEKAAFQRLLDLPAGEPIPVLMFYGVGGTGKSWLLKRLQRQAAKLPTAYLDLDPRSGGTSYHIAWAKALAELRRQLGPQIKCPRFDLAYTWLRFKEGVQDEPHFHGTGFLAGLWDLTVEAGNAATSSIPGASLVAWAIKKVAAPVNQKLKDSGLHDWLARESGQIDFLKLKSQQTSDIYPQLHRRLLQDLHENLPPSGKSVRAVIFLDTIETIHADRDSDSRILDQQQWLRDLYHPDSGLLVVLAGRDHLHWGHDPSSDFAQPQHLEQHLVGGLSEPDAREYLTNCQITDPALQSAILHVSEDLETAALPLAVELVRRADSAEHVEQARRLTSSYHAFSLGLCADTCHNLRLQNLTIDPATFDMPPDDTQKLAARFLRSLGGDGTYAQWLHALALTPQFDETAARAAFSDHPGAEQDAAWRALLSYSFVRPQAEPGWYTLHLRMRDALEEQLHHTTPADWTRLHTTWKTHWSSRTASHSPRSIAPPLAVELARRANAPESAPINRYSAAAWYHSWQLDPESARLYWDKLVKEEHLRCRMANHYALLNWWKPCRLEDRLLDPDRRWEAAAALNSLGVEYWKASQGDRSANLQTAIDCYKAALRVCTQRDFPEDWATTQCNLGNTYADLPTGDREANLQAAINCYTDALRAKNDTDLSWARTQSSLGLAYANLPKGNRFANLQAAINCYSAAINICSETDFPEDWAMIQINLGAALGSLSSIDRRVNVQTAIKCYTDALRVYTENDFPQNWATTQNNLGVAYADLGTENHHETNLVRAIDCYNAALRVRTETDFPEDWAMTQVNLGTAYANLLTGGREANLIAAIDYYNAALRVRTETDFPEDWASTQYNLGIAHMKLQSGNRGVRLDASIACYTAALRVYTETDFPQRYASTHNNLGIAYAEQPAGDRGGNLHTAIICFTAALRVSTETNFPQEWAKTTGNIALAKWTAAKEWTPEWTRYGWIREALWQQADDHLTRAIAVFESIGHDHQVEKHRQLLADLRRDRDSPSPR